MFTRLPSFMDTIWTLSSLLLIPVVFPMYKLLNSFQIMFLSLLSLIQLTLPLKRLILSPLEGIIKLTWTVLGNCSFVRCPVNVLCEQYLGHLNKLLDKHAPLVTRTFTKQAAGWLSDSYRLAKAVLLIVRRLYTRWV